MKKKLFKIIAFFLCFSLLFEQSGFAQVAGQIDLSGYFAGIRSSLAQDKFRPLHLRYLDYDNTANTFKLLLDKGDVKRLSPRGTVPEQTLQDETKTLLKYVFIGITLPNESFWVNLRPDSPDNIIDPYLAQTDIGKILLEADLQLKKDTALATSPETHEGRKYWDKLYKKAEELFGYENVTIPTLTRPWIVPNEIIIRETPANAYIYKATLKVMLEQDYLKDSATYNFKDPRLKALNEYSSQLIRELIIPKLTKKINSSKKYAALRQVYYSLILAQWFKQRFYGKGGLYSWLINKRNLTGLTSTQFWSQDAYFKAYQQSFKDGEYNIQEPRQTPYGQTVRSYFSGGIIPIPQVPYQPGQEVADVTTGASCRSIVPRGTDAAVEADYLAGFDAGGGTAIDPGSISVKDGVEGYAREFVSQAQPVSPGTIIEWTAQRPTRDFVARIETALQDKSFITQTVRQLYPAGDFDIKKVAKINVEKFVGEGGYEKVYLIQVFMQNGEVFEFVIKADRIEINSHFVRSGGFKILEDLYDKVGGLMPKPGAVYEDMELWTEEYIDTGGNNIKQWRQIYSEPTEENRKKLEEIEVAAIIAYFLFCDKSEGYIQDPRLDNFVVYYDEEKQKWEARIVDVGTFTQSRVNYDDDLVVESLRNEDFRYEIIYSAKQAYKEILGMVTPQERASAAAALAELYSRGLRFARANGNPALVSLNNDQLEGLAWELGASEDPFNTIIEFFYTHNIGIDEGHVRSILAVCQGGVTEGQAGEAEEMAKQSQTSAATPVMWPTVPIRPSLAEIESLVPAVHATDIFPERGIIKAAAKDRNVGVADGSLAEFRLGTHWALGGLMAPHEHNDVETAQFGIVMPLGELNRRKQVVNLSVYDTFTIGDQRLSKGSVLIVPVGTETSGIPQDVTIVQYDPSRVSLRQAVDEIIHGHGWWSINTVEEGVSNADPAYFRGQEVNNPVFFREFLKAHPCVSYGSHINSIEGEAFRMGSIERAIHYLSLEYYGGGPAAIETIGDIKLSAALIRHNLAKLDRWVANAGLDEEFRELYARKKQAVLDWLNVIDLDMELRENQGQRLAGAPEALLKEIRRLRGNPAALRGFVAQHMAQLSAIWEEDSEQWTWLSSEGFVPIDRTELQEFIAVNPALFGNLNGITMFHLLYAMKRGLLIGKERAKSEGLDAVIRDSLLHLRDRYGWAHYNKPRRGTPEVDLDKPMVTLFEHLGGSSNFEKAALALLAEPIIQEYFSQRYNIDLSNFHPLSVASFNQCLGGLDIGDASGPRYSLSVYRDQVGRDLRRPRRISGASGHTTATVLQAQSLAPGAAGGPAAGATVEKLAQEEGGNWEWVNEIIERMAGWFSRTDRQVSDETREFCSDRFDIFAIYEKAKKLKNNNETEKAERIFADLEAVVRSAAILRDSSIEIEAVIEALKQLVNYFPHLPSRQTMIILQRLGKKENDAFGAIRGIVSANPQFITGSLINDIRLLLRKGGVSSEALGTIDVIARQRPDLISSRLFSELEDYFSVGTGYDVGCIETIALHRQDLAERCLDILARKLRTVTQWTGVQVVSRILVRLAEKKPELLVTCIDILEDFLRPRDLYKTDPVNTREAAIALVRIAEVDKNNADKCLRILENVLASEGLNYEIYGYTLAGIWQMAREDRALVKAGTLSSVILELLDSGAITCSVNSSGEGSGRHFLTQGLPHYEIYLSPYFKSLTQNPDIYLGEARDREIEKYYIALSVYHLLRQYGYEISEHNIRLALDLVIGQRQVRRTIYSSGTQGLNIIFEFDEAKGGERMFKQSLNTIKQVQGGDIHDYIGADAGQGLSLLSTMQGHITIFVAAHGLPRGEGFSVTRSEVIYIDDLADALLAGGRKDLRDITLLFETCYSHNLALRLLKYLQGQGTSQLPTIISISPLNETAYVIPGWGLAGQLREARRQGDLELQDILVQKYSGDMADVNLSIFTPYDESALRYFEQNAVRGKGFIRNGGERFGTSLVHGVFQGYFGNGLAGEGQYSENRAQQAADAVSNAISAGSIYLGIDGGEIKPRVYLINGHSVTVNTISDNSSEITNISENGGQVNINARALNRWLADKKIKVSDEILQAILAHELSEAVNLQLQGEEKNYAESHTAGMLAEAEHVRRIEQKRARDRVRSALADIWAARDNQPGGAWGVSPAAPAPSAAKGPAAGASTGEDSSELYALVPGAEILTALVKLAVILIGNMHNHQPYQEGLDGEIIRLIDDNGIEAVRDAAKSLSAREGVGPEAVEAINQAIGGQSTDWQLRIEGLPRHALRGLSPEQRAAFLNEVDFLVRGISRSTWIKITENISGLSGLRWEDIDSNPSLEYIPEGDNKYVFKLTLSLKDGEKINILLATKIAKGKDTITDSELEYNQKLQGTGWVPKFGASFKSANGRVWYVEEFIEGLTIAEDVAKKGKLDHAVAKKCIRTLMDIFFYLNRGRSENFVGPSDFHRSNLIIRENDPAGRVVLIDFGEAQTYRTIEDFLLGIVLYYGGASGEFLEILEQEYPHIDWVGKLKNIAENRLPGIKAKINRDPGQPINGFNLTLGRYDSVRNGIIGFLKAKGYSHTHSDFTGRDRFIKHLSPATTVKQDEPGGRPKVFTISIKGVETNRVKGERKFGNYNYNNGIITIASGDNPVEAFDFRVELYEMPSSHYNGRGLKGNAVTVIYKDAAGAKRIAIILRSGISEEAQNEAFCHELIALMRMEGQGVQAGGPVEDAFGHSMALTGLAVKQEIVDAPINSITTEELEAALNDLPNGKAIVVATQSPPAAGASTEEDATELYAFTPEAVILGILVGLAKAVRTKIDTGQSYYNELDAITGLVEKYGRKKVGRAAEALEGNGVDPLVAVIINLAILPEPSVSSLLPGRLEAFLSGVKSFLKRLSAKSGRLQENPGAPSEEELTLSEYIKNSGGITAGELVALQTHLNRKMSFSSRFSQALIGRIQVLVDYWNHNIANFIARQFADSQRGVVELIANALDASPQEGADVVISRGEIIVSNAGKGIGIEEILTCLLIPTYTTKPGGRETIGRFGVGFLSSLNYLNSPQDTMEIVSFNEGAGFKVVLGVRFEGKGRNRKKIVVIKSIQENIPHGNAARKYFPESRPNATISGTSIRIQSGGLNNLEEISAITETIRQRFAYYSGEPVRLRLDGGETESIGMDKGAYLGLYSGEGENQAKNFQVFALRQSGAGGFDIAENPGEARLIITLQGVVLADMRVPGSNVCQELLVNLPASTIIPTSRDRVVIDEATIQAIFRAAEAIAADSSLSVSNKIAVLNSLHYLLDWASRTNESLVGGRKLDGIVARIIEAEQKKLADSKATRIFLPDTLQAREFFKDVDEVIFVNPRLLGEIAFAGSRPQELSEGEISRQMRDNGFKVFIVKADTLMPALRLGSCVFIKAGQDTSREDVIWQQILAATALNYWEYMMSHLDLADARFESAGQYSGVDEGAARKAQVLAYLEHEVKDLRSKVLGEQGAGFERKLELFEKLLSLVKERSARIIFYAFREAIGDFQRKFPEEVKDAAQEAAFGQVSKILGTGIGDFGNYYKADFKIYEAYHIPIFLQTPSDLEEAYIAEEEPLDPAEIRARILTDLLGHERGAPKVGLPEGLEQQQKAILFMIEVMLLWSEKGGSRVNKFIEKAFADPALLQKLLLEIGAYLGNKEEVSESDTAILLDYLNFVFINSEAKVEEEAGQEEDVVAPKGNLISSGKLSDIVATFLTSGKELSSAEEIIPAQEGQLSTQAAEGQIQQSINYQDPEEFVFIRELLVNIEDEIKAARARGDSRYYTAEMRTRLVNVGGRARVEFSIIDPIGMGLARILNYLLIPNRSSKTEDFMTGFFGHGFFTALRESEEVIIETANGDGAFYLRLVPVLDKDEGVVVDVKYELYRNGHAPNGTRITWRKRGDASALSLAVLQAKAAMFAFTMENHINLVKLNNKVVLPLRRETDFVSRFSTPDGQICNVFIDHRENPSIVIQDGHFASRFDRKFITEVLEIPADSDLFKFMMKLADAGVIVELPAAIKLTRDRGHFIKSDFTPSCRQAVVGAIFDAAIKCVLTGNIEIPYDFSYDFLTQGAANEALFDPVPSRLNIIIPNYYGAERSPYPLAILLNPAARILNVVKNWPIAGKKTFQEFRNEMSKITKQLRQKITKAFEDFVKSPEFAALLLVDNDSALPEAVSAAREKLIAILEKAGLSCDMELVDNQLENFRTRSWPYFFSRLYQGLVEEAVLESFSADASLGSLIQKLIAINLALQFARANPLDTGAIANAIDTIEREKAAMKADREAGKAPPSAENVADRVAQRAEERKTLPQPLKNGISLQQASEARYALPYLYYFLLVNQFLINGLMDSSRRVQGRERYWAITPGVYFDASDYALARGGVQQISWNLASEGAFHIMRELLDYLRAPSEEKLEKFLSDFIETLTHEMTHEEESSLAVSRPRDTHNKAFFERQGRLLDSALKDPALHAEIKDMLARMAEEYSRDVPEEGKIAAERFLQGENQEAADEINRVISELAGNAQPLAAGDSAEEGPSELYALVPGAEILTALVKLAQMIMDKIGKGQPYQDELAQIRALAIKHDPAEVNKAIAGLAAKGVNGQTIKAINEAFGQGGRAGASNKSAPGAVRPDNIKATEERPNSDTVNRERESTQQAYSRWAKIYDEERGKLRSLWSAEESQAFLDQLHNKIAKAEIEKIRASENNLGTYALFPGRPQPWNRGPKNSNSIKPKEADPDDYVYHGTSLGVLMVSILRGYLGGVQDLGLPRERGVSESQTYFSQPILANYDPIGELELDFGGEGSISEDNYGYILQYVGSYGMNATRPARAVLIYYAFKAAWERDGLDKQYPFPPIDYFLQKAIVRIPVEDIPNFSNLATCGGEIDVSLPVSLNNAEVLLDRDIVLPGWALYETMPSLRFDPESLAEKLGIKTTRGSGPYYYSDDSFYYDPIDGGSVAPLPPLARKALARHEKIWGSRFKAERVARGKWKSVFQFSQEAMGQVPSSLQPRKAVTPGDVTEKAQPSRKKATSRKRPSKEDERARYAGLFADMGVYIYKGYTPKEAAKLINGAIINSRLVPVSVSRAVDVAIINLLERRVELGAKLRLWGVSDKEIAVVMSTLENKEFFWFNAVVQDQGHFVLGSKNALAVNIIQYLLGQPEAGTFIEEYILHEAIERTSLNHYQIIQLTQEFFHRERINPEGWVTVGAGDQARTMLGYLLRRFINENTPFTGDQAEAMTQANGVAGGVPSHIQKTHDLLNVLNIGPGKRVVAERSGRGSGKDTPRRLIIFGRDYTGEEGDINWSVFDAIELAVPGDAGEIEELRTQIEALVDDDFAPYDYMLRHNKVYVLVYKEGGKVIAYTSAQLYPGSRTVSISETSVREDMQGQRIGTTLRARLLSDLEKEGYVEFRVLPTTEPSVRIAERFRFQKESRWVPPVWVLRVQPQGSDATQGPDRGNGPGGIDFRAMPIVTQPVANSMLSTPYPALQAPNLNLDKEWSQIERMMKAGIKPSTNRIKEYVESMERQYNSEAPRPIGRPGVLPSAEIDKVLSCIADILRQEEQECCSTEPALRQLLALLESGDPLGPGLERVQPLPKEPKNKQD